MSQAPIHTGSERDISEPLVFAFPQDADREWRAVFGDQSIQRLFAEQAEKTPFAAALRSGGEEWTYRELDNAAEYLARRLVELGLRTPGIVAVHAGRSIETIVGVLAILKAGAAYMALDAESPPERLAAVLEKARPAFILTQTALAGTLTFGGGKAIYLDVELEGVRRLVSAKTSGARSATQRGSPSDLAYVSFTSGTSGSPKGVCIPHRGVIRLVKDPDYVSLSSEEVFLQFAPLSFDASTFEIWGCLLNGARLAIFPPGKPSLDSLGEFIEREGVTILWLTAGLFHQMVDGHLHFLRKVRQLIVGGSVLSVTHVERAMRALPRCRFINGYGPTENTTFTCCHPIQEIPADGSSIPIGKPIARTYCRVLDEQYRLTPQGLPGELCAGGDGLALGYLGDADLTAERFIPDPFSEEPGAKLYRTGDRVRELANGGYEILGRMDRQVKVGGFRVELDEVEAALSQHPEVREAAAHVRPAVSGYERLTAFLSLKPGAALSAVEVRKFLQLRLPAYMIPAVIIFLEMLPLNANGKIDREALLRLDVDQRPASIDETAVSTEEALVQIWTEVLGFGGFTNDQEFFHLGGTSLSATHLLARIQTVLRKSVPMKMLVDGVTIASLAKFLDERPTTETSLLYPFQPKGEKPTLFCLPCQAGDLVCYANMERHFPKDRPVYGVQSNGLFDMAEGGSIEEIAASCVQTILRQQAVGPFHLCGYCFGGLLAYEVARQLWEKGAWIGAVIVMDYSMPGAARPLLRGMRTSSVGAFLGNLWLACAEYLHSTAPERAASLRRLKGFVRSFLRRRETDGTSRAGEECRSAEHLSVSQALYGVHDRAALKYAPRRYRGEVTLLRPRRLPVFKNYDASCGWNDAPVDKLRVKIVHGPGWHGAMLREPHVAQLVPAIERCLQEAESMPSTPPIHRGATDGRQRTARTR